MFVCGPTVYDYAHIGHARTYIVFDVIARWLRQGGFKLFYLQNITDIDDKIIDRAKKQKKEPREIARFFEKEYLKDMKQLAVESVDKYARAGDHIKEIKAQIDTLLKKGFAYETDSGIYFEIKKFPRYGQLSKQKLNTLRPGWRIEPDPQKKDPLDFALWKKTKDSKIGRPGWHIEDTAISEKYLGRQYDLHGAAVDLKFPHHESEIAQQESISGKRPMVKIWIHVGFLLANGEKMSKSLGNFITIRDFLKKYPANVLRLIVLSHHYRSPINYTAKVAKAHQSSLNRINKFMHTLVVTSAPSPSIDIDFKKALDDDFNTAKALAVIFDFIAAAPKTEKSKKYLSEKLAILGVNIKPPLIPAKARELLKEREKARKTKDFKVADKIRNKINKLGFEIEDK